MMIHTIQAGDILTMVGPDGRRSERFTLAEPPSIGHGDPVWIYREYDAPLVISRPYALDSTFVLHSRRGDGAAPSSSVGVVIDRLKELHRSGAITIVEYIALKQRLT